MNKTITIYELLGLVKDGKQPKHIKYCGRIYTYDNYKGDSGYVDKTVEPYKWFVKECDIERDLNDTVEIIEDTDKLEKININDNGTLGFPNGCWTARNMDKAFATIINGIIDHINKIEEKLDER